jgi:hypothetical protein
VANPEVKDDKPKIRKMKGFNLQYLYGKDKVLFENGVYIPRKDFDEIKDAPGAVKERLDSFQASEPRYCGFDWAYACSTGSLRRKRGAANLVANPRTERARERQTLRANETAAEKQKKAALRQYVFSSAFLVMAVMTVVGIGSAVMSAYHTSTFLYEGGKPAWASLMTGVMLILFSGAAFTAARYFFNEKGAERLFGALFVAAGLAVIAYSMFSTLTVNFNQFQWRDDEQAAAVTEGEAALVAHREQARLLEEELKDVSNEIGRLEGEAAYWRGRSWARYDEAVQRLAVLAGHRTGIQAKRMELVGETPRLAAVEAVSQETVYGFLADLFEIKEEAMRFFVYVVPACLYDILAPFALSVVLLLLDKRRRQDG